MLLIPRDNIAAARSTTVLFTNPNYFTVWKQHDLLLLVCNQNAQEYTKQQYLISLNQQRVFPSAYWGIRGIWQLMTTFETLVVVLTRIPQIEYVFYLGKDGKKVIRSFSKATVHND